MKSILLHLEMEIPDRIFGIFSLEIEGEIDDFGFA
jgi:hypothetical protein